MLEHTIRHNLRDWSAKELLCARAPAGGGRAPIRRDGAPLATPAQLWVYVFIYFKILLSFYYMFIVKNIQNNRSNSECGINIK